MSSPANPPSSNSSEKLSQSQTPRGDLLTECCDCGRSRELTELSLVWVLGRLRTLCVNPWSCWEATSELRLHQQA